jgi:hypothetical protein
MPLLVPLRSYMQLLAVTGLNMPLHARENGQLAVTTLQYLFIEGSHYCVE